MSGFTSYALVGAVAPTLGGAMGDLALAILVAIAGSMILTVTIGLAMRGGAGFVDLDREGRFPAAIMALVVAAIFSLIAVGVVIGSALLLIRG